MPFDSLDAKLLESVLHSNIEAAGIHMAKPVESTPNAMTKGRDFIITIPADFGNIEVHQITREVVLDFQKYTMNHLAGTLAKQLKNVGRFDADAQTDPLSEPLEIRTIQDRKSGNLFHCIKLSGEIANRTGLLQLQDKKSFHPDQQVRLSGQRQSTHVSNGESLARMKASQAAQPPSREAYRDTATTLGETRIVVKPGKVLGLG